MYEKCRFFIGKLGKKKQIFAHPVEAVQSGMLVVCVHFYTQTENSSFPVLVQSIRGVVSQQVFLISISLIYSSQRKMHEPLGNKLFC